MRIGSKVVVPVCMNISRKGPWRNRPQPYHGERPLALPQEPPDAAVEGMLPTSGRAVRGATTYYGEFPSATPGHWLRERQTSKRQNNGRETAAKRRNIKTTTLKTGGAGKGTSRCPAHYPWPVSQGE
jgi:hypothetical protein